MFWQGRVPVPCGGCCPFSRAGGAWSRFHAGFCTPGLVTGRDLVLAPRSFLSTRGGLGLHFTRGFIPGSGSRWGEGVGPGSTWVFSSPGSDPRGVWSEFVPGLGPARVWCQSRTQGGACRRPAAAWPPEELVLVPAAGGVSQPSLAPRRASPAPVPCRALSPAALCSPPRGICLCSQPPGSQPRSAPRGVHSTSWSHKGICTEAVLAPVLRGFGSQSRAGFYTSVFSQSWSWSHVEQLCSPA